MICRRLDTGEGKAKVDRAGTPYWLYRMRSGRPVPLGRPDDELPEAASEAEPEPERAAPDTLDRAYRLLIDLLELEERHREALQRRGLPDEEISWRGYRSLPARGRLGLAKRWVRALGDEAVARAIPGLYAAEDGRWCVAGAAGLLIPVRDRQQRIVALLVRQDEGAKGPKYVWVSSKRHGGVGPGAPVHTPLWDGPADTVRLTEGALKADIATALGGLLCIGLPGVSTLQPALPVLRELGARRVLLAFDADARRNQHVAKALERAADALTREGFTVELEIWPEERGKGIDDLLAAGHQPERCQGVEVWQAVVEVAADAGTKPDPVAAARAMLAGLEERVRADRRAAFEPEVIGALATLWEKAPAEYGLVKLVLQEARVSVRDVERAMRAARRQHLRVVGEGEDPERPRVRDRLADAPVPESIVVPEPYELGPTVLGYWHEPEGEDAEPVFRVVASAPVIIAGRLRDEEERIEYLRLAWRRPDGWRTTVVDRGVALDGRRLITLASEGFPVYGGNAARLAEYLEAFETANYSLLPRQRVASHLGWQGRDGERGFLWGCTLITPSGETVEAPIDGQDLPEDWREDWTSFRPLAPGDAQIAAGFHAAGTLAGWVETVAELAAYPRALLAVYAACVPPLLSILGAPNFIVDLSARTSTGKTTVLRAAASVWGCPDERRPESALGTWDSTRVWVERASAVLHGLPLILDDTKRAKQPQTVADVLYLVASGRGRGRGNPRSLSRVGTWRTVLLSSGEARATSFTQDGGTRARTIEILGMPFGDDGPATGLIVDRVNVGVLTHYGHAGPALIRWLLRHRDEWADLRAAYEQEVARYAGHRTAIVRRQAQPAAAIAVAAACLHAALNEAGCPLPFGYRDPLADLWESIAHAAEEAAPELRALRDVASWAYSHVQEFWGRHVSDGNGTPRQPSGGWAGRWDPGESWEWIGFYPTVIRRVLQGLEYEPDAILQGWHARGWLVTDTDRDRFTKRMRVGDERAHLVVIRRDAIEESERSPDEPEAVVASGDSGDKVGTGVGTYDLPF